MCKHVASLLYQACKSRYSCTDKLQIWHKPKLAKRAVFIEEIATPKATPNLEEVEKKRARFNFDPRPVEFQTEKSLHSYNLDKLANISMGKSAILRYSNSYRELDVNNRPEGIGSEVEINTTAYIHINTIKEAFTMCNNKFDEFEKLLMSNKESLQWLAKETSLQSECNKWFVFRQGRITSSKMHAVVTSFKNIRETKKCKSIIANVMGYYETPNEIPALKWGKCREKPALKHYIGHMRKSHKQFSVKETGLILSAKQPYIAASPDGLVSCHCCKTGLVEIKNPYTHKNITVTELSKIPNSGFNFCDNSFTIEKNHYYYSQIQTQMYCTDAQYCDLVIHTATIEDNMVIIRIYPDNDFICNMVRNCKLFYKSYIFPELQNCAIEQQIREHYVKRKMEEMLQVITKGN